MRQTLVFSDLHLSPAAPGHGIWMRFRQPRYFADSAFVALVDELLGRLGEAPLEVVFNGDTFELDGAAGYSPVAGERHEDMGREESELAGLEQILTDHHVLVEAMGRLLGRAERLVFVSGNHDQGLIWPGVQALLRERLVAACRSHAPGVTKESLAARILFQPWFHRTADGIHVEHGHQLDPDSAVPDPLLPTRPDGKGLWLSLGSVGLRHILGRIGTMNPHAPGSFQLGGPVSYLVHYGRYYLFRGRSLMRTWVLGAIRSARHVLRQERAVDELLESARLDALAAQARSTGLSAGRVRRLRELMVKPSATRPFSVWRILWLDRLAFAGGILLGGLLAWLLAGWAVALALLALLVTAYVVYEHLAGGTEVNAYEASIPLAANGIAGITKAPVVVLGHTHSPCSERLPGGAVHINTGSWAPAFGDAECMVPVRQDRTFAWVHTEGRRVLAARLLAWRLGELVAHDGALLPDLSARPAPARPASPSLSEAA